MIIILYFIESYRMAHTKPTVREINPGVENRYFGNTSKKQNEINEKNKTLTNTITNIYMYI